MRIAWFSPLNTGDVPLDSTSAYASELLLPLIREQHQVELFHNSFEKYQDYPTFHYLNAFLRHKEEPFDFFFYQMEDKPCSRFLRIASALMPGIVWFHDLLFLDYGPEPVLNSSWRKTVERFQGQNDEWPERGAEFEQEGPLGFREAAVNFLSLFSSERDHDEYRRNISTRLAGDQTLQSLVLPLPVNMSGIAETKAQGGEVLRIGFIGSPRIENRCYKLFHAISELQKAKHSSALELVWCCGDSEAEEAEQLLEEFGLLSCSRIIPDRSPQRWQKLLPEIDIAVHTLFSVFGQSGPYIQMSLAAGLPVVSNRFGTNSFFSEALMFLVDAGSHESLQYQQIFSKFMADRSHLHSAVAREFAVESFDHRAVGSELLSVFEKNQSELQNLMQRWSGVMYQAREEIQRELDGFLGDSSELFRETESSQSYRNVYRELGW